VLAKANPSVLAKTDLPVLIKTDADFLGDSPASVSVPTILIPDRDAAVFSGGANKPVIKQNLSKLIGDNYYLRRLIQEQIAALSGRRFAKGFSNDLTQYKALLSRGAAFTQQYQITPGVALSEQQMQYLTSDLVLLVNQQVTLIDGSQQTVLVPQVYLKSGEGDIDGRLSNISAEIVDLKLDHLSNDGLLVGRRQVKVDSESIDNSGEIDGDAISLLANKTVSNSGGRISGGRLINIEAKGDINLGSELYDTSNHFAHASASGRGIAKVGSIVLNKDHAVLNIHSGNDLSIKATRISNLGKGAKTFLSANDDVSIGTERVSDHYETEAGIHSTIAYDSEDQVGSDIQTSGDVTIQASQGHLQVSGSNINSVSGVISAYGKQGVDIDSAVSKKTTAVRELSQSSNLLGHKSTEFYKSTSAQNTSSSSLTGKEVQVGSEGNINIRGSNVIGDNGTLLSAGKDVNILASENRRDSVGWTQDKKSGLFADGGLSLTIGKRDTQNNSLGTEISHTGSMVGNLGVGNTTIIAGGHYKQVGSVVQSVKGDVNVFAKDITVSSAMDSYRTDSHYQFNQSGVTVALSSPAVDALKSLSSSVQLVGKSKNSRVNALAVANASLQGYQSGKALQQMGKSGNGGGLRVSLTYGKQKNSAESHSRQRQAHASQLLGGGKVNLLATGGGKASNIHIIGSDVWGKQGTKLSADHDVVIEAAKQTAVNSRRSHQSGWNAGLAIAVGQGISLGVTAGVNGGKGHGNGDDVSYRHSHVGYQGSRTEVSAGDLLSLKGAQLLGKGVKVSADSLSIESLQDHSQYSSKKTHANASLTAGAGVSGSGNYGNAKVNSDYANVSEQSGILSGDEGFEVNIKQGTRLVGGVITSTKAAELAHKNHFSTGTLSRKDLFDYSKGSAKSSGLGFAYDSKDPKTNGGKYHIAKTLAENALGQGKSTENQHKITYSVISKGDLTASDTNSQKKLNNIRHTVSSTPALKVVDEEALSQDAKIKQQFVQTAVAVGESFTDEAFDTLFVKSHPVYKTKLDKEGKVIKDKHGHTQYEPVSAQELKHLQVGKDGKIHVAVNGIFNDKQAAAKYDVQNSVGGEDAGESYFIYFPEADNAVSESLVAGYQKVLENSFFGLSKSTKKLGSLIKQYGGKDTVGIEVTSHSRGTLTAANALSVLKKAPHSAGHYPNIGINMVGPAANVKNTDSTLASLQGRDGVSEQQKSKMSIHYQTHKDDFVGTIIGGNKPTGGRTPKKSNMLKQWLHILGGEFTVHNCYGQGEDGCRKYWKGSIPEWKPIYKVEEKK
ncbi:MAG: hemagglutinin repeat-containing protein, partial [Ostreibacterium sp.]